MNSKAKAKAKAVILALLRQSTGNAILGKTKLFKAFYFAHLYYAKATNLQGYLSTWPIVRMQHGPGIDQFDQLISELRDSGELTVTKCEVGPFPSHNYQAHGESTESLNDCELQAIEKAATFVASKTGSQLSDITHDLSRTWNELSNGEEMPVHVDLLTDDDMATTSLDELIGVWRGRQQAERGQLVSFEDVWRDSDPAHTRG